jgi:copper transport protein
LNDEERIFAFKRARNRFVRLAWTSLFLLLASLIASLVLQTSAVLDVGAGQAFSPSNLYQTLTQTAFGLPFLMQACVTLVLFGIVFFISRQKRESNETTIPDLNDKQSLLWAGLIISSLLFLMPSLTGHAQAAAGEFRFTVFTDWLHQIVAGAWIGGLFHLILTLPEIVRGFGSLQRLSLLSRVIPFFSRMAIACAGFLTLTGIYSSWIHVDGFSALLNTSYGLVLLFKIALFLFMLALGGLNTFVLRPRAARLITETNFAEEEGAKIFKSFNRALTFEVVLGILVLLLAAILAFLPPARRHETIVGGEKFLDEINIKPQAAKISVGEELEVYSHRLRQI